MSYLLSINASTRGENSWSNRLLKEFENGFLKNRPDYLIVRRSTGDVPHLDFAAQKALRQIPNAALRVKEY